jgi:AcrR family transcriptional regulator
MTENQVALPGRPRNASTDGAILDAVLGIVAEKGVSGVTVTGVAARAGVARATVYLRWPSRAALVGAAAKAVAGGDPFALSGDLERDIWAGAAFLETVFAAPYFAGILPELVRATLATPAEVSFDALAPNRQGLAAEYRREAAAQGFDTEVDPTLVFDLYFGAGLAHLLATGEAPSPAYVRQLAEVVVRGLRAPASQRKA